MGNLTSPKFPEDEIPGKGVLHPDGLILGGLPEPITPGGLNLLVDRHPADINATPYTVRDGVTVPPIPPDYNGFYTGLAPYDPGPVSPPSVRRGLNGIGYIPGPRDAGQLARLIMAEGASTPDDMNALGWAIVNRVGNREFGRTLQEVVQHPGSFESVGRNSPLWRQSAKPESFTGQNAAAWQRAKQTAQGILDGDIYDPTNGAVLFFSSSDYDGKPRSAPGDYKRMLDQKLISPSDPWVRPSGTTNYFFKENKR